MLVVPAVAKLPPVGVGAVPQTQITSWFALKPGASERIWPLIFVLTWLP